MMREQLITLVKQLQSDRRLTSFDEAATKQAIILHILTILGWDIYNINEVKPEYSVGGKSVDYSLRHGEANKVFIEVKRVGEDLDKHQEQLLNYSFREGVNLSILTNGITWWFYLPLYEGSWEQRKFYTIELYDQEPEIIVNRLIDYLGKDKVCSGEAIEIAKTVYKGRQKEFSMMNTLPLAWNRLVSEPDELLIELLAENTEKLCGYKPDNPMVANFIFSNVSQVAAPSEIKGRKEPVGKPIAGKLGGYTGMSVAAFTFKKTRYEVRYWVDVLTQVCNLMRDLHGADFGRVLQLKGTKRPYFSRNRNELRAPQQIEGTEIFIEVNLNSNFIVKMCLNVLSLFGYSDDDFTVEAY